MPLNRHTLLIESGHFASTTAGPGLAAFMVDELSYLRLKSTASREPKVRGRVDANSSQGKRRYSSKGGNIALL